MAKYQDILENTRRLKAMTGLDRGQFDRLLPYFEQGMETLMKRRTIDGYLREGRRYSEYRNSPLPTVADKLLFILTYLKTNPMQEVQGQLFQMSQSNVSKWFHLLHDGLNLALAQQNLLPARDAETLTELLRQQEPTLDSGKSQTIETNEVAEPASPPLFS